MKYTTQNGFSKDDILRRLDDEFLGKAAVEGFDDRCVYLTREGKKCAVGLFIADGHPGQDFHGSVFELVAEYDDLLDVLPLSLPGMTSFQRTHDNMVAHNVSITEQKNILKNWIEENVV